MNFMRNALSSSQMRHVLGLDEGVEFFPGFAKAVMFRESS